MALYSTLSTMALLKKTILVNQYNINGVFMINELRWELYNYELLAIINE